MRDLGLFRVVGQPNLNVEIDRPRAARYQISVTDVQDAIQQDGRNFRVKLTWRFGE